VLAVAVIGVVFAYVLPKIASYGKAWSVAETLSDSWILVLCGVTLLNVLSNVPPWMAALPGIGFVKAARVALASNALSIVAPGGIAVGAAAQVKLLRSWGLRGSSVALATTLTNVLGQLVTFGFPVLAIGALSAEGGHNSSLDAVAFVGVAAFVVIASGFAYVLWNAKAANQIGYAIAGGVTWTKKRFRGSPVRWGGPEFVHFRAEALQLLRRRWAVLTISMLASQLAVFLVLIVTLRALGVSGSQVTIVEAFASWSLIRALGKIPITPGGFGVEEIALTGALIGFGAHNGQAVSATLIYRFLTVFPSIAIGIAAATTFRVGRQPTA